MLPGVVIDGQAPTRFAELRELYFERQAGAGGEEADVDHIAEIPLELARSYVGFKHDAINLGISDTGFHALKKDTPGLLDEARKPKWKFW